ncbi:apolipoprotein N-acyltransferase [Blastochloris sulfoviridis]|uniref:Apolipoprotein N-acyltransferase n=2 Tax=Blastochloris sulfoviridis TaxID=50712 RepID=A0A5M6I408_9HYPH|nr:apolipoprotein N-acyltransferase [Blastochloris sulfoviridis]
MAPLGALAWPVIFLTFPVLVWLLDGAGSGGRRGIGAAAAIGWWFGFGYFLTGLWWIGVAFLVDADKFGWLLPVAVAGLPAGLALFTAAGTALARALWVPGPARVLALAVGLTAAEWLRGHVLTGLPWNSFGYALASDLRLAQTASLGGLWSLTFLAVALGALPAVLADAPRDTRHPWRWVGLGALVLAAMFVFGAVRLATTPVGTVEGVRLRLMQPNLPQDVKFRYAAKDEVVAHYLKLSDLAASPPSGAPVTHLIWPESAFPFFLSREPAVLAKIADHLPPGTVLITGAARAEERPDKGPRRYDVYNSVQIVDSDGAIIATADKVHLVPFGEYLPFQATLESLGLEQLTRVQGGFSAGTRRRALEVPGAPPTLPLICFEIVFPGAPAADLPKDAPRPGWMLNLTNDGWFGDTSGPHQHLAQARLRAIEEGMPVVRAANTGISGVVDPLGRMRAQINLGREGIVDADLPRPVTPPPYARLADAIPLTLWLGALAIVIFARRVRGSVSTAKLQQRQC